MISRLGKPLESRLEIVRSGAVDLGSVTTEAEEAAAAAAAA